jgi:hypothetical protein
MPSRGEGFPEVEKVESGVKETQSFVVEIKPCASDCATDKRDTTRE